MSADLNRRLRALEKRRALVAAADAVNFSLVDWSALSDGELGEFNALVGLIDQPSGSGNIQFDLLSSDQRERLLALASKVIWNQPS